MSGAQMAGIVTGIVFLVVAAAFFKYPKRIAEANNDSAHRHGRNTGRQTTPAALVIFGFVLAIMGVVFIVLGVLNP